MYFEADDICPSVRVSIVCPMRSPHCQKFTAGTGGVIVCYACFAGRRRRESRVAVKEVVRSLTMEMR